MKIIVATNNDAKVKEIKQIIKDIELVSLKEINCEIEVIEDGKTFEENAKKKAKEIYEKIKMPCIADDSGIEIKEYSGWPGVLTARFLGEDKSGNEHAKERNEYILNKMKDLKREQREVKNVTCIAYCDEKGVQVVRGELSGVIAMKPKGENGFGFDEIFELENGKTLAELTKKEKNKISSRKKALEKISKIIKKA